jgi:flagellar basal-body rod protein FlgF
VAGSIYVALSGMQARLAHLDRVAADIANEGTAGYKGERSATVAVSRNVFDAVLDAAVDTAPAATKVDFSPGVIQGTGRSLDVALDGPGFLVVQTTAGVRYTRNGRLSRSSDGSLITIDGSTVLGEDGPIKLADGRVTVDEDGTIAVNGTTAGKLKIVDFADRRGMARESDGRFRAADGAQASATTGTQVRDGALEQSNVSVANRMAQLTEVSRGFEALQRGLSLMSNDVDGKAVTELGRVR